MIVAHDQYNRRTTYQCDNCGKRGPWGPGWVWYGSLADLDDDKPVTHGCSMRCAKAARKKGVLRAQRAEREALDR